MNVRLESQNTPEKETPTWFTGFKEKLKNLCNYWSNIESLSRTSAAGEQDPEQKELLLAAQTGIEQLWGISDLRDSLESPYPLILSPEEMRRRIEAVKIREKIVLLKEKVAWNGHFSIDERLGVLSLNASVNPLTAQDVFGAIFDANQNSYVIDYTKTPNLLIKNKMQQLLWEDLVGIVEQRNGSYLFKKMDGSPVYVRPLIREGVSLKPMANIVPSPEVVTAPKQERVRRPPLLLEEDKASQYPLFQKKIIRTELTQVKSPLTPDMFMASSKEYGIPATYLAAVTKNDSLYGTSWLGARTNNPWNVWNTDDWKIRRFPSREEWLRAAAKVIKERIDAYIAIYGDWLPPIKHLMENRWPDGKGFLPNQRNYKRINDYRHGEDGEEYTPWGAYMTHNRWPSNVAIIASDLDKKIYSELDHAA